MSEKRESEKRESEKSDSQSTVADWDTYWQGSHDQQTFSDEGVSHPAVADFWRNFFSSVESASDESLLDVASGAGAVIEAAIETWMPPRQRMVCLDSSAAAVNRLIDRFPAVTGLVADALRLPVASQSVNIATSQFGVEYAGIDAIEEMFRVVSPGGSLALVLHHKKGSIYSECAAADTAVQEVLRLEFFDRAAQMFREAIALADGAERSAFESAAKAFEPAFRGLEPIMDTHGRDVGGGSVLKLYNDVSRIYQRMQHYDLVEIIGWLERMGEEFLAFSGRMASMCAAAIDEAGFRRICENVRDRNFALHTGRALQDPSRIAPLGWVLVATRDGG